jgi:murein hydrolase activator
MLKRSITYCLFASLAMTGLAQQPGKSDALKKQQAAIQREISELRSTLSSSKKDTKVGLQQLKMVQRKLELRKQAIENINQQVSVIDNNIGRSKNEIGQLTKELDTLKANYAQSVVYAYKSRSNYEFVNFVFSAASFNDLLHRIEYLRAYRRYREEQALTIRNTQLLLTNKVTGLKASRTEKGAVLQKQQLQKQELQSETTEKREVLSKLKAREKEITKELADKQRTDRKLKFAIQKAIDNEMTLAMRSVEDKKRTSTKSTRSNTRSASAKTKTAKKKPAKIIVTRNKNTAAPTSNKSFLDATPEGMRISGGFEMNKGRLPWPVDKGYIKAHFGNVRIEGFEDLTRVNPALTIGTDRSAAVKAVFEGVVTSIFDVEGSWAVVVKHGKYFTVYSGLSSLNVANKQQVNSGDVLGRAGANTDTEIDFIIMQEKKNLDPEKWIRSR